MSKLPGEIVASALAVTTVLISLPPYHFPPWAIFIGWAATYAMGGPSVQNMRRIWPVMPIGSLFAFAIVLGFQEASKHFAGASFIVSQMVILFCLNATMMLMSRLPGLGFTPGMFFGFASYFATMFGGFGPVPHDPVWALLAVLPMNALGPVYAWLKHRYSAPEAHGEPMSGMASQARASQTRA